MKKRKINRQHSVVKQIQRRVCSWAMSSALVLAVIFILFHENAIAKGLLLGTLFSVINFLLLGKSIPMTLGQSRSKASLIGLGSILSRFAVLAIPMIVGVKSVSFNFVAVVAGIFAVQIVTLVDYIVIKPILGEK